jgi:hypothetical protein
VRGVATARGGVWKGPRDMLRLRPPIGQGGEQLVKLNSARGADESPGTLTNLTSRAREGLRPVGLARDLILENDAGRRAHESLATRILT